jgi:hypothetical protein
LTLGLATLAMPAAAQDRDPFERGTVSVELALAPLVEAWHLNDHREPMLDGSASFWGAVGRRVAVGIEFHNAYVFQHPTGAFVQGISPLVRVKVKDNPAWDWFVEIGPGVSWSDVSTPPRGTKFNYLAQFGVGVLRTAGPANHVVLAYRLLHLSNHYREGRDRNPDLEMMGFYAGWSFSF